MWLHCGVGSLVQKLFDMKYLMIQNFLFIVPLTVYRDGMQVLPDGQLIPVNQISNLNLQCLGDATQNHVNLMWIASRDGEMTQIITANSDFFQVQYNGNEANLTVINSARPFRGKLRCYSPLSGVTSTVIATDSKQDVYLTYVWREMGEPLVIST